MVRWVIEDGAIGEALFFTGINFSGQRARVRFFPGGRMQGDEIDGTRVKSFGIIASYGLRVTLCTARGDVGWEDHTWRAVTLVEGSTFESMSGKPAIQVPDLDVMDAFDARRTDLELRRGYPEVDLPEQGEGWTFGYRGGLDLKCNVKTIRVENILKAKDDAEE